MSPRADPVRVRHAVLLASVVGLKEAGKRCGVSPARLCQWRKDLEVATGESFPRRNDLKGGRSRQRKLTGEQRQAIRRRRAEKGTSFGRLALVYGVSIATIRRVLDEGEAQP